MTFRQEYLQLPILRNFTVEDVSRLLEYAIERSYEPGQTIFTQGDPGRELYVIVSGKVRFEYENPNTGEEKVLAWAGFGMLFGEIGFLQPQPRTAAAIAEERTELLLFQRADVQKLIDLYPTLAATFYHAIALELSIRLRDSTPRIS